MCRSYVYIFETMYVLKNVLFLLYNFLGEKIKDMKNAVNLMSTP